MLPAKQPRVVPVRRSSFVPNMDAPRGFGETDEKPEIEADTGQLTSAAAAVAYAGALPLIAGVLLAWSRPEDLGPDILRWMSVYGVALLAFFGGVRWGTAVMLGGGPTFSQLIGAAVPFVLAVAIFPITNVALTLAILVVAIPILLFDDLRATQRGSGAPAWYLGVRVPLTIMMELSFIGALFLAMPIW